MELMNRSATVTTFDNKVINRDRARRIKGEYYEIGVTCFRIKEEGDSFKWHRINNGKIAKNGETGEYERIETLQGKGLERGIIDKSQDIVFMKPDKYTNVFLKDSITDIHVTSVRCRDAQLAEQIGYTENLSDGFFYNTSNTPKDLLKEFKVKRTVKYETALSHNANEKCSQFLSTISNYSDFKKVMKTTNEAEEIAKLIGQYSFGLELETSKGFIPKWMLGKLGLVPLRDGSITGHEYTTVPLEGYYGVQTISDVCKTLTERCEVNQKCSFHVHLGGFNRTFTNMLALYETCLQIQGEMYELVLPYKKDPIGRAGLEKDYCKPLPNLGIVNKTITSEAEAKVEFNKLFFWASGNSTNMDKKWHLNTGVHPQDTSGNAKWNISVRYSIFNFVPLIFSKAKTWESRLHHGTLSFTKVMNWILINAAILNFAEKNAKAILAGNIKIDLKNIIKGYSCNFEYDSGKENIFGTVVSEYLLAYIKSRKKLFNDYETKGNYIPKEEYTEDSKYQFEHGGFNIVF